MQNNDMSLNEYQSKAADFRIPTAPPEERIMGLLEESGEVAAIFKRLLRGDYGPDIAATKLFKELGDILWYVSQIAGDNDWTLEEVAKGNIEKLDSRKLRNLIVGTGDDR
jgi:NTP pyrophosphatase (non-canonical NTP hydrolase)